MARFIDPCIVLLFAIISLTLSNSKSYYQKVVEGHGESFANQAIKILRIGGYLLLICALLRVVIIFFSK
jgi:hypothetical protein